MLKKYFINIFTEILEKSIIQPELTIKNLKRSIKSKDRRITELKEENQQLQWINHKLQVNDQQVSKKKRNRVFKRDNYQCKKCEPDNH